jgi:hypothetical protein
MENLGVIETERCAVFCTALVDSDPLRYQSWIDYYTEFFNGENIDLYLYNDGPVSSPLNLRGAKLITFPLALGRQEVWIFPGWKRSFSVAVHELGRRYAFLGHIESDTVILNQGRAEFLRALRRPGYRTGYSARHRFVETALQILNTPSARDFFVNRYSHPASYNRYERFEKVVQYTLRPRLMLHGERVEGRTIDLHGNYSYLAQIPIYLYHQLFPDGDIPWTSVIPMQAPLRRLRIEMLRLRWTIGYLQKIVFHRLP